MRLGIDATNIGKGGGVTHLIEILNQAISMQNNDEIEKIIVFSSKKVLLRLPESYLIDKVTFPFLNINLFFRTLFHIFSYDREIYKKCDILFSITGDYIGRFKPVVGMSRNMLLYERTIWKDIKCPMEVLRFWLNYLKQRRSFKNSAGIIFISEYAQNIVSKQINLNGTKIRLINHGVSDRFRHQIKVQSTIDVYSTQYPFRLLYVSTVHVYKHQWNVVRAVSNLRKKGYPLELTLVGDILFKPAGDRLFKTINESDPDGFFIHYYNHIQYSQISEFYKNADGIVFASTCENMPNILLESMSSGIPIVCSDKQPMPEFLKKNGFYFDSYNVESIENAIEKLILNPKEREIMARNNLIASSQYSWIETTQKTFQFLEEIYKDSLSQLYIKSI
jgi:glycosyltransferase involved in cell wall biosynthesis